jgi:hypothetical protein
MQFHVGQYVRDTTGTNSGTGQINSSAEINYLNAKDGKVHKREEYIVTWLDVDGRQTQMRPQDLAPSARAVPESFATPEEAEAWMEEQASGGGWIDKVDDDLATIGELPEKMAQEAVEQALTEDAVEQAIQAKIDEELRRLFGNDEQTP